MAIEHGENPLLFVPKKSVGQQQPSPVARVTPVYFNRNRPSYRAIDFSFVSLGARRVNVCRAQLLGLCCLSCVDSVIHNPQFNSVSSRANTEILLELLPERRVPSHDLFPSMGKGGFDQGLVNNIIYWRHF